MMPLNLIGKQEFSLIRKIREINYKGEHFIVPGPSITEPTPQRLPVILQAGASKKV